MGYFEQAKNISHGWDPAGYLQGLWYATHQGFCFGSTVETLENPGPINHLAIHLHLILFLLVPLYLFFPSPLLLPVVQTILLGLAAIPIYRLARNRLGNAAGLLFILLYFANPFTSWMVIEGFTPRTLAMVFLLYALFSLLDNRPLGYFIFNLLAIACTEDIALATFALGLYAVLIRKKIAWGIPVAAASLVYFILAVAVIQPALGFTQPFSVLEIGDAQTAGNVLHFVFLHPGQWLHHGWTAVKLKYFLRLFAPWGFLSFLSPALLLPALPHLFQNVFLAARDLTLPNVPRYTAPLYPFVIVSSIYGLGKCRDWLEKRRRGIFSKTAPFFILMFLATIVFNRPAFRWMPFDQMAAIVLPLPEAWRDKNRALLQAVAMIPPDASVSADQRALRFLAQRKAVYAFPMHLECSYLLISLFDPIPHPVVSRERYLQTVQSLRQDPDYEIIFDRHSVILFRNRKALP
jgi:uncharacterized membrane protein